MIPAFDYFSAGSPDGARIAFTRVFPSDISDIFVMNADGSGQTNLTNTSTADVRPDWSTDGARVAFGSHPVSNWEVFVMNADGSDQTNLTNNPALDWGPNWSADDTKIAFETDRTGDFEIFVMNADGSGQTNLTNSPSTFDADPDWSPDGTKIAFARGGDGLRHECGREQPDQPDQQPCIVRDSPSLGAGRHQDRLHQVRPAERRDLRDERRWQQPD